MSGYGSLPFVIDQLGTAVQSLTAQVQQQAEQIAELQALVAALQPEPETEQ